MRRIFFLVFALIMLPGIAEARTHHHRKHLNYSEKLSTNNTSDFNIMFFSRSEPTRPAKRYMSRNEVADTVNANSSLINRARRYVGANARQLGLPRRLWCADFMNMITHSGSDRRAISYAHRGSPASYGCIGCVAVTSRKGGNHVGVVENYDKRGNPVLISGNHGHRVGIGAYAKYKVVAYRYI